MKQKAANKKYETRVRDYCVMTDKGGKEKYSGYKMPGSRKRY